MLLYFQPVKNPPPTPGRSRQCDGAHDRVSVTSPGTASAPRSQWLITSRRTPTLGHWAWRRWRNGHTFVLWRDPRQHRNFLINLRTARQIIRE
ncbi:hypothetical protein J6590_034693 [Homalodisca vitripennis]|nr:hypothetical protein J6590_034693 [Homalodisca vitripennis]